MGTGGMSQQEAREWQLRQWAAREVAGMLERMAVNIAEEHERRAGEVRNGLGSQRRAA